MHQLSLILCIVNNTPQPYKVDTDTNLIRGQQFGFNICNSTTQNQNSNCQTSFLNSLDGTAQQFFPSHSLTPLFCFFCSDFCLWAPAEPNSDVANEEGEMVAWCTKPGHGSRLIPAGALQGVQFMKTPDYVQVVGFVDQAQININTSDWGGEMDPHGADLVGFSVILSRRRLKFNDLARQPNGWPCLLERIRP